jgi:hypothetical protein
VTVFSHRSFFSFADDFALTIFFLGKAPDLFDAVVALAA